MSWASAQGRSRAPGALREPSRAHPRYRSSPITLPGPVLLDLVAAVLQAGAPVTTALRVVAEATAAQGDERAARELLRLAARHDLALGGVDGSTASWVAVLDEALLLARESGSAVAPLLAAAAAQERRRQAAEARAAAARLGVRVVLPTGLACCRRSCCSRSSRSYWPCSASSDGPSRPASAPPLPDGVARRPHPRPSSPRPQPPATVERRVVRPRTVGTGARNAPEHRPERARRTVSREPPVQDRPRGKCATPDEGDTGSAPGSGRPLPVASASTTWAWRRRNTPS